MPIAFDAVLVDLAFKTRLILRGEAGTRRRLLATYARIKGKQIGFWLLGRPAPRHETLLGQRIEFFSYRLLVRMFEEIFVRRVYAFTAPTDRPVIVDGGSNIGLSVLYFKWRYPGARVTAFEPGPDAFAVLRRNVETNHWGDVEIHNRALGGAEGPIDFYVEPDLPGSPKMSTRPERTRGTRISVPAVPLSRYVAGPVDFLKLDIEGAELDVLEELTASGKLPLIRQMVIEYHHHISPGDDRFSRVLGLLERHGYGYEISTLAQQPFAQDRFQDILVYAYLRRP